jgi:hypothetical protein
MYKLQFLIYNSPPNHHAQCHTFSVIFAANIGKILPSLIGQHKHRINVHIHVNIHASSRNRTYDQGMAAS